jgi:hypothetical protein
VALLRPCARGRSLLISRSPYVPALALVVEAAAVLTGKKHVVNH